MGFLDSIFGSQEPSGNPGWELVTSKDTVDEILMASGERPQVVLKHSTRCGTSYFAKKNLDNIPGGQLNGADLYIIDVIRDRDISLYLGDKVRVRHESPQLFVFRDGEVSWHGSHYEVNEENLIQALG